MRQHMLLALALTGCNYDYAIMEAPEALPPETIVVYQQEPVASPEAATDTGEPAPADTDTPVLEETDEQADTDAPEVVDTDLPLEDPPTVDSDPPVDTGVVVEVDTGDPPPPPPVDTDVPPSPVEDTDIPPPLVEDTGVVDTDVPTPPVDTAPPVDTEEPPPPPPEPDWSLLYYEDFSDGLAQDWSKFNGGCGSQGVGGEPPVWNMASDWNGARVPVPEELGAWTRLTVEAEITRPTSSAVVRWLSNPVAWNTNDDGGISFYYVGASGAGAYVGGHLVTPHPVFPEVVTTLEVETLMDEYLVSVDGVPIAAGSLAGVGTLGGGLEVHGNGSCSKGTLIVHSVKIESASY